MFGQTQALTGMIAETKELGSIDFKEQSGVRPSQSVVASCQQKRLLEAHFGSAQGEAAFRDNGVVGGAEKKSEGRQNFGNQNSRNGNEKQLTRLHSMNPRQPW
jgi:hypothetical protein